MYGGSSRGSSSRRSGSILHLSPHFTNFQICLKVAKLLEITQEAVIAIMVMVVSYSTKYLEDGW